MRRLVVALLGLALAGAATIVPAAPANATIHEIVAQWCAGKGELQPPGIQSGKNAAQPVFANGFITGTEPFRDGLLVTFNYNLPSAKVIGTGDFIVIGQTDVGPLYAELVTPDVTFAAFQHCPNFSTS